LHELEISRDAIGCAPPPINNSQETVRMSYLTSKQTMTLGRAALTAFCITVAGGALATLPLGAHAFADGGEHDGGDHDGGGHDGGHDSDGHDGSGHDSSGHGADSHGGADSSHDAGDDHSGNDDTADAAGADDPADHDAGDGNAPVTPPPATN
jgi:hypothetical protein